MTGTSPPSPARRSSSALPPITFYLPFRQDGISTHPVQLGEYWRWITENRHIGEGKYSWTLQTYLYLSEQGFPCTLSERFPDSGIVVSHRDFLPIFQRPRPEVFLVCVKADRKEHTWARSHIVQNDHDALLRTRKGRNRCNVIRFWPQPALMPRRASRGNTCEAVAYYGRALNLAAELRTSDWQHELRGLGFSWSIVGLQDWNNYAEVDVTVSVRSFEATIDATDAVMNPDSKPPTKLINSWLAGVPAIVGRESAYQGVRTNPLDFIEVTSADELKQALLELRSHPTLYSEMVANGLRRAEAFSAQSVGASWEEALRGDIAEAYGRWQADSAIRRWYEVLRDTFDYFANVQHWKDLLTAFDNRK